MAALCLLLALAAPPVEAADTLVVCPPAWRETMRPWLVHRTEQGHVCQWVSSELEANDIRAAIRSVARSGKLKYVLLVGDAEPAAKDDAALRSRSLPTHLAKAQVNVKFGSEPEIATDNWYANLDDDRVPDLAVGRLTADTPEELALMLRKILAYERTASHGPWRQRINLIAGVGGFGAVVDSTLEMATKRFITEGVPAAYDTTMTYGSWRSPYCPDPRLFHATTVQRLNEGCLFWVYIGHGQKTYLDQVRVPGSSHHILASEDIPKLKCKNGSPIALFLACYAGAFDQPEDCLAEEMLRTEGGPVAVFAGSRVTMPYAMSVLGTEMLDEYFRRRPETLGELLLAAKQRMVAEKPPEEHPFNRRLIDSLAALLSPHSRLDEERVEHLALFNLLGDPLLRLSYPSTVKLDVEKETSAGQRLAVSGTCDISGPATIELVCRRDFLRFSPPVREQFDRTDEGQSRLMEIYQRANDNRWTTREIEIRDGKFATELQVPDDCQGLCHVRVFVEGQSASALGSAHIFVRRASVERTARP